jgi:hypothetical protein
MEGYLILRDDASVGESETEGSSGTVFAAQGCGAFDIIANVCRGHQMFVVFVSVLHFKYATV